MSRLMGKNQNRKTSLVNCHLKGNFSCQLSLERHRKMKHQHCVEELINKRILSDLIATSCEKITADQCFPASTRQAFDNFILNDQETENIFQEILPIIKHHLNLDKYFQHSFNLHSKNQLFGKQIGPQNNSALLQMELTNQILLHIRTEFDVQPTNKEMGVKEELTKNEIYALQYLAGYIFHKFYKKFKQQLKNNEIYMQYCSILLAGKVYQDEEQILVNAKNRGGLWKVDSDVQNMFLLIEKLFRKETKIFVTKINDKCIIETAMQDPNLLQFYENRVVK